MTRSGVPRVAQVLLVAHASRLAELAGWLRVEGEEVGYTLHLAGPREVPDASAWDVVVVDGESLVDDRTRLALLRRLASPPRSAAVLYVCGCLPLDSEIEHATAWADDLVYSGWAQPERVRRRVQVVALAPWRRSKALRRAAESLGDRRLCVLPGGQADDGKGSAAAFGRVDPSHPIVLLERAHRSGATPQMVAEAFHVGRRVGVTSLLERFEHMCGELTKELDETEQSPQPEHIADVEATFSDADVPAFAARLAGARGALEAIRVGLRGMASSELEAIEQHTVRPADES